MSMRLPMWAGRSPKRSRDRRSVLAGLRAAIEAGEAS